ncbi:hypothetical protein EI555_003246, partial [Monodon monoceros]
MRRRNRKTRRYGVLDTNIENMELTPLEQDDEDDDNTLFDVSHPRSAKQVVKNKSSCKVFYQPSKSSIMEPVDGNVTCYVIKKSKFSNYVSCQQQAHVLWQLKFNLNDIVDSISKYCEANLTAGMHLKLRNKLALAEQQLLRRALLLLFDEPAPAPRNLEGAGKAGSARKSWPDRRAPACARLLLLLGALGSAHRPAASRKGHERNVAREMRRIPGSTEIVRISVERTPQLGTYRRRLLYRIELVVGRSTEIVRISVERTPQLGTYRRRLLYRIELVVERCLQLSSTLGPWGLHLPKPRNGPVDAEYLEMFSHAISDLKGNGGDLQFKLVKVENLKKIIKKLVEIAINAYQHTENIYQGSHEFHGYWSNEYMSIAKKGLCKTYTLCLISRAMFSLFMRKSPNLYATGCLTWQVRSLRADGQLEKAAHLLHVRLHLGDTLPRLRLALPIMGFQLAAGEGHLGKWLEAKSLRKPGARKGTWRSCWKLLHQLLPKPQEIAKHLLSGADAPKILGELILDAQESPGGTSSLTSLDRKVLFGGDNS